MKMCAHALGASVVAVLGVAAVVPAANAKAMPARNITFDGGNCTAKFVRSASGIINETNRTCEGDQNPWVEADVTIQFRPLDGKPNPASPFFVRTIGTDDQLLARLTEELRGRGIEPEDGGNETRIKVNTIINGVKRRKRQIMTLRMSVEE